ncbi:hypothetical protein RUM44_001417 [Polyplax serrata]|uniref:Ig-like domain-containing protein n=1 Tax=Polyplax serrata TaxID=468196 RepID=A0ABR1AJY6_POLSC
MLTGSHREQRFGYISGSENLKITTVSRPVLCLPTGHQDHMVCALPNSNYHLKMYLNDQLSFRLTCLFRVCLVTKDVLLCFVELHQIYDLLSNVHNDDCGDDLEMIVFWNHVNCSFHLHLKLHIAAFNPMFPLYQVTAVQGDPVYMPCNISTSEEGDAVVIVLWYREDLGTPIYTVDTRDRSILQADRWSADNVFANRAYFMPDKVPAELGVDHVKESDAGVYRCRVDFRKAQTRNTRVNLTVIEGKQKTFQIWRLDSNLL